MSTVSRRGLRWAAAGALTGGLLVASAGTAAADKSEGGSFDAPPTCFTGHVEVHSSYDDEGKLYMGTYDHVGEFSYQRHYGNGYETRYVWVYEVTIPTIRGHQTVGFAHKLCGADWTETSSNVA